jgi:sterol desaturase/sphingolipid hydroxylase (fatty acid hydroxylase superfamily)
MTFWEHHTEPLASERVFIGRVFQQFLLGLMLVFFALCVGMTGYMLIGKLNWVDAFLESCMLLSGAGPLYTERDSSNALKIFSSLYCLFGTLVVVVTVGLLATPVVHRILHRVHFSHSKQP